MGKNIRMNKNLNFNGAKYNGSLKSKFPIKKVVDPEHSQYIKVALETSKILNLRRQAAMNNISQLKKYASAARDYAKYALRERLEEKQSKTGVTYPTPQTFLNYEIAPSKLTKSGDIATPIIKSSLETLAETFNIEDSIPIMAGNTLIKQLINAPKTIVGEMAFNAVGKHDRPCFVIRKLLTCKINNLTYLLLADEKYYQNSPTVAYPLTLIACGETSCACQLSRIDSIGHLGADIAKNLEIDDQVSIEIPDYLLEKFESSHHNAVPSNGKKSGTAKKTHVRKIAGTHHIHERDDNFELLYALSHMAKTTIYRCEPQKFLKFNAKEIRAADFYVEGLDSAKNNYLETLKLISAATTLEQTDALHNSGVISTALLQEYFAKKYNITNFQPNPQLAQFLDELRTFKPDRQIKFFDAYSLVGERPYMLIPTPQNNKLEQGVKKMEGKLCDYDYAKEKHPEIVEEYRKYKKAKQAQSENSQTSVTPENADNNEKQQAPVQEQSNLTSTNPNEQINSQSKNNSGKSQ